MELVLLTFGLLFAILRISARSASDKAGPAAVRTFGEYSDFKERHCDEVMEQAIMNMIEDEKLFDDIWDKLERSRSEYSTKIYSAPDRELKIWDALLSLGRRPLAAYSYNFRESRKFRIFYGTRRIDMTEGINQRRALHCLMWLQGKECMAESRKAYDRMIKPWIDDMDNIANFDEVKWDAK